MVGFSTDPAMEGLNSLRMELIHVFEDIEKARQEVLSAAPSAENDTGGNEKEHQKLKSNGQSTRQPGHANRIEIKRHGDISVLQARIRGAFYQDNTALMRAGFYEEQQRLLEKQIYLVMGESCKRMLALSKDIRDREGLCMNCHSQHPKNVGCKSQPCNLCATTHPFIARPSGI